MTRGLVLALLVCALAAAPVVAQQIAVHYHDESAMPEGTEGARIQLLLDAVNENDVELATRFHEEHLSAEFKEQFPLGVFIETFRDIVRETGGIDFHGIRTYEPPRVGHTVVIFYQRNYESWQAFVFAYAEGTKPDGPLVRLGVAPARTPTNVEPEGPLTEEEAISRAAAFVERLCERDLFSGTVLVAREDDVLFEHSCGEASKRFHAPIDMDTKFNIGSMNKMFTATAVMQLVEQGILCVHDTIDAYVDTTWLPRDITGRVAIKHLLSHTSGLGSYFNDTFMNGSRLRWRELDDYRDLVVGDTLAFEPGTDWQYSNTGMFLLGVVIESVTGENYFDYMRQNVYGPAGMEDTDCYDMDCPVENLAVGYWRSGDCPSGWKNNYYEHVVRGGPAGGGFSTARDLHRFARAMQTGALVSRDYLEPMWTVQFDRGGPGGYGYGFGVDDGPAGRVVGHSGGFTGINANLDIFLDSGYVSAVLTNYDMAASPVASKIKQLLARVE